MLTCNEMLLSPPLLPPLLCKARSIRVPAKVALKHFPGLFSVTEWSFALFSYVNIQETGGFYP